MHAVIARRYGCYFKRYVSLLIVRPTNRDVVGFERLGAVSVVPAANVSAVKERGTPLASQFGNRAGVVSRKVGQRARVFCFPPAECEVRVNARGVGSSRAKVAVEERVRLSFETGYEGRLIAHYVGVESRVICVPRAILGCVSPPRVRSTVPSQRVEGGVGGVSLQERDEVDREERQVVRSNALDEHSPVNSNS